MINYDEIGEKRVKSFARLASDIDRLCQDEDGTVYLTTKYGVFILKEDRIFEFISKYNDVVQEYKSKKPLSIQNYGQTVSEGQIASINLLSGAKHTTKMYEGYTFIPAYEPTNLGTKLVKSTFRVSSKDDTIIHCYKGTVINYIKVLLGNSINYSIGDYTDIRGNKGGVLAAESSNGKAYVLSLPDSKGM